MLLKGQVLILGRRTGKPTQWRRWVWFNVDYRWPPTQVCSIVQSALQIGDDIGIGHERV